MMKKQLVIFLMSLLACLVVFSANVYAECSSDRCYGKIERLYVSGNTLYISTDGDESLLDCTAPSDIYVTIHNSDPNFKTLYAMMLTSMSVNNTVIGMRIENGSSNCSLVYTYMDNIPN
jgi:hypothetical protein